jgi:ribonuclease HI
MILYTDGASRGNPGPAGIGFVLYNSTEIILEKFYFLGNKTNNFAEAIAILVALYIIKQNNITNSLIIKSDSLLLINQFKGIYKIKNDTLKLANILFKNTFADFNISFIHIDRTYNKYADSLANRGIDEKKLLSQELLSFLSSLF